MRCFPASFRALNDTITNFRLAREAGEDFFGAMLRAGTNIATLPDQIQRAADALRDVKQAAAAAKSNPLRVIPGLTITDEDVKAQEAKYKALIAIRNNAILAGQGDNSDQVSRRFLTKPALDYTGAKDKLGRMAGGPKDRISEAQRYLDSLEQQLQKTQELTTVETVLADVESGRLKLSSDVTLQKILSTAGLIDQAKEQIKLGKEQEKILAEEAKAREQIAKITQRAVEAANRETQQMADQNKSYREETELIGKDAAAIERIMQARLDDAIAAKQQQLAMLQNADASQGEIGALEDQINLLQQRKGLLTQRGVAEQLAADAEEAKRINDVFVDSFTEGVTSIVTGAKSVKAAFHDMEKSIVDSLTRMAAKRAGKLLFGGSGSSGPGLLGDLGSWFQKLLGGALGGGGGGAEEVFQFGRAVGGPVAANHPYIVGEKGQELFVPRQAGNIIPNDVLTSMRAQRQVVNNISVNVLPGASRETGRQAAMEMARQLNQAAARNG